MISDGIVYIILVVSTICVFIFAKIIEKHYKSKSLKCKQPLECKQEKKITVDYKASELEDVGLVGLSEQIQKEDTTEITPVIYRHYRYKAPVTYEELLTREEWREKRAKIMARDNNCCCCCKSQLNLQVHHKYYLQYPDHKKVLPWEYSDDALITLCDKCHKRWHEKHKVKVYYVSYYHRSPLQGN